MKPTVSELNAEIVRLKLAHGKEKAALEATMIDLGGQRVELRKQIETKDAAIARLKSELHAALLRAATQDGYIARALEDDAVREIGATVAHPMQTIADAPRRNGVPPVMQYRGATDTGYGATDTGYGANRHFAPSTNAPPEWFDL